MGPDPMISDRGATEKKKAGGWEAKRAKEKQLKFLHVCNSSVLALTGLISAILVLYPSLFFLVRGNKRVVL